MSSIPTPWAIICPTHGSVFFTEEEYLRELTLSDVAWMCPICEQVSHWNQDNYESYYGENVDEDEVA